MSETVSMRLPPELVELMEREAKAKGVSLSMLLRAIVEEHYKVDVGEPEKPFLVELQEALDALGGIKMSGCPYRGECPHQNFEALPAPLRLMPDPQPQSGLR